LTMNSRYSDEGAMEWQFHFNMDYRTVDDSD
jgi:hypothetical protein